MGLLKNLFSSNTSYTAKKRPNQSMAKGKPTITWPSKRNAMTPRTRGQRGYRPSNGRGVGP